MAPLKVGIDFGTNYTYMGIINDGSDEVQLLFPAGYAGNKGIPSLYYNNGQEFFGYRAAREINRDSKNGVVSVKRRMMEKSFTLKGGTFTPLQVIIKLLTYFMESAEQCARDAYHLEFDSIEVVMTMPVDFDATQEQVLRNTMKRVTLASGTRVDLLDMIFEPVASAVRYVGMKGTDNQHLMVFDLGGGTLDIAVLRYDASAPIPYQEVDHGGIRDLGGDMWDEAMERLLIRKFREEIGKAPTKAIQQEIQNRAREIKEELSDSESAELDLDYIDGDEDMIVELEVTRQEFEQETADLMARAVDEVVRVMNRQREKPALLLLTGGSSRMPQVRQALEKEGVLPAGTTLRAFKPERAIVEGATVFAQMLTLPEEEGTETESEAGAASPTGGSSVLNRVAAHGYGIIYAVPERNGDPMIRLLIKKGDKLPITVKCESFMSEATEEQRKRSIYTICESDVTENGGETEGDGKYITINGRELTDLYQGRELLEMELVRESAVPVGTKAVQILTLSESGELSFRAVDEVNHVEVENKNIALHSLSARFE